MAFFQAEYAKTTDSFLLQSEAIKNSIQLELGESEMMKGGTTAQIVSAEEEGTKEEVREEEDNKLGESIGDTFGENPRAASETSSPESKSCRLFSVFVEGTLVYREAFRCAWLPIMAQFVNFIITLSLFPGVGKYGGNIV